MTTDFREAIKDFKKDDFLINIISHTLIVEYNQRINPQKTIKIAECAHRLSSL